MRFDIKIERRSLPALRISSITPFLLLSHLIISAPPVPLIINLDIKEAGFAPPSHQTTTRNNSMEKRSTLYGSMRDEEEKHDRAPFTKPPFSLGDLKKAIPAHCFHRSILRSLSYLVSDLAISCVLYLAASYFISTFPTGLRIMVWPMYWVLQGCILTGVWVIAHECGHHAFSDYPWLDDIVGLILHSGLLVPYFSWKYSHRRHHSNTGSLERDEVFVPKLKRELPWFTKCLCNPPGRLAKLLVYITLGWPLYLAFNVSGRKYERLVSHYDPRGPIFNGRERLQVVVSDVSVLAFVCVLYKLAVLHGFRWVIFMYGVPLMIVNGFLVIITYLQHTHAALPHYDSSEWDWLRGALSTMDRDYGILNLVFHNITDTHVVHHLFSSVPHYHALEATRAVRPILGEYCRFDSTPILQALWRETRDCIYVECDRGSNTNGVFWYRNRF